MEDFGKPNGNGRMNLAGNNRLAVSRALGVGEDRLRAMERVGSLPAWGAVDTGAYLEVLLLRMRLMGLSDERWSPQRIDHALGLIRSGDWLASKTETEEEKRQRRARFRQALRDAPKKAGP